METCTSVVSTSASCSSHLDGSLSHKRVHTHRHIQHTYTEAHRTSLNSYSQVQVVQWLQCCSDSLLCLIDSIWRYDVHTCYPVSSLSFSRLASFSHVKTDCPEDIIGTCILIFSPELSQQHVLCICIWEWKCGVYQFWPLGDSITQCCRQHSLHTHSSTHCMNIKYITLHLPFVKLDHARNNILSWS